MQVRAWIAWERSLRGLEQPAAGLGVHPPRVARLRSALPRRPLSGLCLRTVRGRFVFPNTTAPCWGRSLWRSYPMIARIHSRCPSSAALQRRFLTILPRIKTHARVHFRDQRCHWQKADLVAEVVALARQWFVHLARRGKDATHFPAALAAYAARAVRSGRRVCGQLKARDVLNERAQQRHGFRVGSLPHSTATAHENLYGRVGGQRRQDE
jgi:hypothetical protein